MAAAVEYFVTKYSDRPEVTQTGSAPYKVTDFSELEKGRVLTGRARTGYIG